ncbi:MAG TPA: UDP-N-acetylglucosamine 1-carboxyvinyltransferase [Candidatus Paceibacterota bacterium]
MNQFIIKGGKPLVGTLKIKGAKNSFTKLMVASLLTDEMVLLKNCPLTLELTLTTELLRHVGSRVSNPKNGSIIIHSSRVNNYHVQELSRKNRIPILALAPLLHRLGRAEVPFVGGDAIGARPVNFHLDILRKMGARIRIKKNSYEARSKRLEGAVIVLPFPSVGATETGILAGVLASGRTVIKNAAQEPEIIDLISLLQKMGALIELDTNRVISIEGVNHLRGTEHRVIPDRLEAVSFAVLALATDGNILVEDARQEHLITFLNAVRRIGGEYQVEKNGIRFFRKGPLKPLSIETSPHPGFMTDWQQPFTVLLMKARGISRVHETVYEDRFGYIKDFVAMGANIHLTTKCLGTSCRFAKKGHLHSIEIYGPAKIHGSAIMVHDIRAGLAHLVAALSARGTTTISGIEHIDRGYERIDARLRRVGADIKRA